MYKIIKLTENQFGEMMAYHGAGTEFDKFNHKKYLSTGAGSQAFGWGTYVTSDKAIANGYAKATNKNGCIKDYITCLERGYTVKDMRNMNTKYLFVKAFIRKYGHIFMNYGLNQKEMEIGSRYVWDKLLQCKFKKEDARNEIKRDFEKYRLIDRRDRLTNDEHMNDNNGQRRFRISSFGGVRVNLKIVEASLRVLKYLETCDENSSVLYEVEIPDDNGFNYIDWHGSLSKEQASTIMQYLYHFQNRFKYDIDAEFKEIMEEQYIPGARAYYFLTRCLRSQKAASLFLMQCGFDGISYVAGTRWGLPSGAMRGARNYVIFDANKVKIVNKTRM